MARLNSVSKKVEYLARLLALFFMFIALCAAFALYQFDSNKVSNLNFFVDQRAQQSRALEQQSRALRQPLEFMVWSKDRARLGESYAQKLRQQINLQPFHPELWALLVFAQGEAKTDVADQQWSMQRALKLNRWNLRNRSLVSRPCVIDAPEIMQGKGAQLCAELFASLPSSMPTDKLARLIGVNPSALHDALVQQGLRTSKEQFQ